LNRISHILYSSLNYVHSQNLILNMYKFRIHLHISRIQFQICWIELDVCGIEFKICGIEFWICTYFEFECVHIQNLLLNSYIFQIQIQDLWNWLQHILNSVQGMLNSVRHMLNWISNVHSYSKFNTTDLEFRVKWWNGLQYARVWEAILLLNPEFKICWFRILNMYIFQIHLVSRFSI
jgi:hypothetical protein